MIGDSLTVGSQQHLRRAGFKVNAKVGRTLAQGMREYKRARKPKVVEMALFTNDDPRNVSQLRAAVRKTIADARRRGGRVVWATIARPPVNGVSYAHANNMLRELARENGDVMGLVDWAREVERNPGLLGPDKVHATAAGYRRRAQMFRQAAAA